MVRQSLIALAIFSAGGCTASIHGRVSQPTERQPPPPPVVEHRDHRRSEPPPPPVVDHRRAARWDSSGWTELAKTELRGGTSAEATASTIPSLNKVTVVVEDGDVHLDDVILKFKNGQTQHLKVSGNYDDSNRTKAVKVDRAQRIGLVSVEVKFKDASGRPIISIWGR
jgi:hypothetical protein